MNALLAERSLSAREIARRSSILAAQVQDPELRVGHQAVSLWVNGSRNASPKHRWLLATLLSVPIANINAAFDSDIHGDYKELAMSSLTIQVEGRFEKFHYNVAVKTEIDLTKPSIYRNWADMLSSWPGSLDRHLRQVEAELFGWIPDDRASPLFPHPKAMVPLTIPSKVDDELGTSESSQRHLWFLYLPGGELDAGMAYREHRHVVLAKKNGHGLVLDRHPLSKVELVGYFSGRVVFRAASSTSVGGTETEHANPPAA